MLTAILISLMLMASGQGAQVLLEKLSDQYVHCSWGAQFWCSSVTTAAACGKTDWCTDNYWSYGEIQGVPCTVMQQLVTNIRTLARASSHSFPIQDDIAVFIVKSCALLQDGESRNQCRQLITDEDILLKLLKLVGSDLSVQSVATAVGVCKRNIPAEKESVVASAGLKPCGLSSQTVIKGGSEHQEEVTGPVCFICQFVMQKLDSLLVRNSTEKQIEAALQKVCGFVPSFIQQKCSAFVSKYTPRLVQLLLRYPPQMICGVIGLCSDPMGESVNKIQHSPSVKGAGCFLCKLIINQVKSMLSDHTTQDEIKAALENVCHQLPPFFESMCDNFVETYEPQLIQMLLSSFTPEEICQKLNLCTDVQVSADKIQHSDNEKDIGCFLCTMIINQVKSMLSDHTTQDEIKAALEKVCHQLPPLFVSVCDTFVETYEPQLIQMLLSSFTPEQICQKLNLCTDVQGPVNDIHQSPSGNNSKPKCFLCKLIINHVKSMLSDHTTQDEIKTALGKVCHLLPPLLTPLCKHFIDISEQELIQMLLSSYTTEQICDKLKMCKAVQVSDKSQLLKFVPENNAQSAALSDNERCSTCLTALYNFQSALDHPNWQSGSIAVLHQLCRYIMTDQELCKLLVDASFKDMARSLQKFWSPGTLCQKAGFCDPAEFATGDKVH